ncbi:MAG: hypothetical protein Q7V63_03695 [Gammaproteobacteria bacterium]|nr:hypothetical protein [Gammaproteobacteria bacterium]
MPTNILTLLHEAFLEVYSDFRKFPDYGIPPEIEDLISHEFALHLEPFKIRASTKSKPQIISYEQDKDTIIFAHTFTLLPEEAKQAVSMRAANNLIDKAIENGKDLPIKYSTAIYNTSRAKTSLSGSGSIKTAIVIRNAATPSTGLVSGKEKDSSCCIISQA